MFVFKKGDFFRVRLFIVFILLKLSGLLNDEVCSECSIGTFLLIIEVVFECSK